MEDFDKEWYFDDDEELDEEDDPDYYLDTDEKSWLVFYFKRRSDFDENSLYLYQVVANTSEVAGNEAALRTYSEVKGRRMPEGAYAFIPVDHIECIGNKGLVRLISSYKLKLVDFAH
ncbi:hypothetical protein B0H94_12030 [Salsuginibacillus halophilus]|uniref:Uncharacterized protein n=1 Tax=Salsuginibacillus halophilus TaxID=517424 RepID=A0A2P8H511_9BACI|nr:hypothetical protein [Salsuginibacillus halophilus]PSL41284.1 hypothetical protein B0H94_12030 [Salsuginibacillus halophilus]